METLEQRPALNLRSRGLARPRRGGRLPCDEIAGRSRLLNEGGSGRSNQIETRFSEKSCFPGADWVSGSAFRIFSTVLLKLAYIICREMECATRVQDHLHSAPFLR